MHVGYARISKHDGSQSLDLQIDALKEAGVDENAIYADQISGVADRRPELLACLKALREGDVLVVWKLDRLGRSLINLVKIVDTLTRKGVGLKVLTGQGADINTETATGRLVFGIFAALAEYERELIRERTFAGLKAARARGRKGGRKQVMNKRKIRLAQAAMQDRRTVASELAKELGVTKPTLYKYVAPDGSLREPGRVIMGIKSVPLEDQDI